MMRRTPAVAVVQALLLISLGAAGPRAGGAAPPKGMPPGWQPVTSCIRGEGVHWADPKQGNRPLGPLLGTHQGRIVFVEYKISYDSPLMTPVQQGWDAPGVGDGWMDLRVPEGFKVQHVDIQFYPKGHAGFEFDHYDVHLFFVPHQEHLKYCP
ncbi:MAG: hypothetical protein RB148_13145 [Armatimonadota bacterium]|nr:hypothetical protein [Armatimonadota bacterium]MDR7465390.1 hypothetical protein [Armatimonadota bacterium]